MHFQSETSGPSESYKTGSKRAPAEWPAEQRTSQRPRIHANHEPFFEVNDEAQAGYFAASPPPMQESTRPATADQLLGVPYQSSTDNGSEWLGNASPTDKSFSTNTETTLVESGRDNDRMLSRTSTHRHSLPPPFRRNSKNGPKSSPQKKDLRWAVQKWREYTYVSRLVSCWNNVDPGRLCIACDKLDIHYGSFVIGGPSRPEPISTSLRPMSSRPRGGPSMGKITLGTLRQIVTKSSSCPLCRLIVKSLAEQKNTWFARIADRQGNCDWTKEIDTTVKDLDVDCNVSWQIDGREKVRDDDGEIIERHCTRRLHIQWPRSSYTDAHLVLMYPEVEWGPRSLFLGRFLTSLDQPKVEQIKKWYKLCSEEHGDNCAINLANEQFEDLRKESYFGVVDIRNMKLTALPEGSPYAALSYTWGPDQKDATQDQSQKSSSRFRATLQNVDDLKKPGGVRDIENQLPRTIRDTISLVEKLGIHYLWVDTLCILQGEQELWDLNASRMDTVYGHAALTICAADGGDANAGLKAIANDELPSKYDHHAIQHVERIKPDLQLMVAYPSETYVERSAWNKRAWTFQERVLSKRCLIFTEGRVYFQCRSATMSEDIHAEEAQAGWSIDFLHGPLQRYKKLDEHPVDVYKHCVQLYTSRFLTHEEDILAAFSGICKEICSKLGGEPIYGLPNSHFDLALLWKPDNAPNRRRKYGKLKFPSWSWCGWKDSRISYKNSFVEGCELNLHDWLMNHTWISWYIRDGQGNLRLVWDPLLYSRRSTPIESRWQGYCGEAADESAPGDDDGYPVVDRYQRKIPASIRTRQRDTFARTIPKYPYQVRLVEPGTRSTRPEERLEDQRFLQFWTWSAQFYLIPEDPKEPISKKNKNGVSDLIRYGIQDGDCSLVGTITLGEEWRPLANFDNHHEFIAISDARGFTEEEIKDWAYVEPSSPGQSEWHAYNVLLLRYDDETPSIARRAGLGKIYKRAFHTACLVPPREKRKEWKEIILG